MRYCKLGVGGWVGGRRYLGEGDVREGLGGGVDDVQVLHDGGTVIGNGDLEEVGGWVGGWEGRWGAGGWDEVLWVGNGWVGGRVGGAYLTTVVHELIHAPGAEGGTHCISDSLCV